MYHTYFKISITLLRARAHTHTPNIAARIITFVYTKSDISANKAKGIEFDN